MNVGWHEDQTQKISRGFPKQDHKPKAEPLLTSTARVLARRLHLLRA